MSVRADLPITKQKFQFFFEKKYFLTVFHLFFIFDVILKNFAPAVADISSKKSRFLRCCGQFTDPQKNLFLKK
jgi:hypothetical protein